MYAISAEFQHGVLHLCFYDRRGLWFRQLWIFVWRPPSVVVRQVRFHGVFWLPSMRWVMHYLFAMARERKTHFPDPLIYAPDQALGWRLTFFANFEMHVTLIVFDYAASGFNRLCQAPSQVVTTADGCRQGASELSSNYAQGATSGCCALRMSATIGLGAAFTLWSPSVCSTPANNMNFLCKTLGMVACLDPQSHDTANLKLCSTNERTRSLTPHAYSCS